MPLQIADRWIERRHLDDDITRVEEEEPEEPPMTDELFLLPAN